MRPPRVTVGNMATTVALMAQYNPNKLSVDLEAVYQSIVIPGQSHTQQQYVHTGDLQFKFDLGFDSESNEEYDIRRAEKFLYSLFYPLRSGTSVANSAPPQVLLGWPNMFLITANAKHLHIDYNLFDETMGPTWFIATLSIEQALFQRLYSDDVENMGPTFQV